MPAAGGGDAGAAAATVVGPAIHLSSVLAVLAIALLLFVSLGVIYLSSVEWRDRRRRTSRS